MQKPPASRIRLKALSLTILYTRAQPSLKLLHARLGEHLPSARDLLKLRFLGEIARASRHFATLHDAIFVFGLSIHPNSLPSEPCSGEFVPSGVVQNRNRLLPRLPGPHQLAHTFPDLGVAWSRGASIFGSTREFGDAGPIAKRRLVWRSQRR